MEKFGWGPVLFLVAMAAVSDLLSRRVPNLLTIPFLVVGLALGGVTGGWAGLMRSAAGAGLAVVLLAAFCLLGGMGWGDLKLCAAVGAWIGPGRLTLALVMTAIAGGLAAVAILLWRGAGYKVSSRLALDDPEALKLPYAPAIAIGTLIALLAG